MQTSVCIENGKKKNKTSSLIIFIISFFTIWSLHILLIEPYLYKNYLLIYRIAHLGFDKLILMALPIYCYLKYCQLNPITFLKLDKNIKQGIKYIVILSILLCVLSLTHPHRSILNISVWMDTIILAPLMDEIMFRGIILQKASELMSFWKANFVNTVLFVLIHFPVWFHYHYFVFPKIISLIFFASWFGLAMGYIFKKSNSIWPCIIIHMINNLLTTY